MQKSDIIQANHWYHIALADNDAGYKKKRCSGMVRPLPPFPSSEAWAGKRHHGIVAEKVAQRQLVRSL